MTVMIMKRHIIQCKEIVRNYWVKDHLLDCHCHHQSHNNDDNNKNNKK